MKGSALIPNRLNRCPVLFQYNHKPRRRDVNDDAWVTYLLNLAGMDTVASRPAIRSLYYKGHEGDWIAEAADIPIDTVRDALTKIP